MVQQQEKNTAAIQHVMERVASLETRMNATERLQDAVDQRVELLSEQRERYSDRYWERSENLEDQTGRLTNTVTELQKVVPDTTTAIPSALSSDSATDSYNGVLLWKISEFEHRRREAIEAATLSLYSTPFYTSTCGYKMGARVYLNGDGLGKSTHLSLFFVLMRGPYDALLQWPFRQKVTLTLINQSGKKHVTDSFRPDAQSTSFQRPMRKDMNIASGCPMFIRIEHLLSGGFIKEDSIFLRVMVDTTDLPKTPP